MRTFNFTLLAMFGCIAMIDATAIGNRGQPSAGALGRRTGYVPQLSTTAIIEHGRSDPQLKNLFPAQTARRTITTRNALQPALAILRSHTARRSAAIITSIRSARCSAWRILRTSSA